MRAGHTMSAKPSRGMTPWIIVTMRDMKSITKRMAGVLATTRVFISTIPGGRHSTGAPYGIPILSSGIPGIGTGIVPGTRAGIPPTTTTPIRTTTAIGTPDHIFMADTIPATMPITNPTIPTTAQREGNPDIAVRETRGVGRWESVDIRQRRISIRQ